MTQRTVGSVQFYSDKPCTIDIYYTCYGFETIPYYIIIMNLAFMNWFITILLAQESQSHYNLDGS